MNTEAETIKQAVLAYINTYRGENAPDEAFNALAMQVFAYQFKFNLPYRKYAQSKRQTPLLVKDWQQLPLMPINGYKTFTLSATPITADEPVFMSSGTTDASHRSHNYHPSFASWDASMKYPFKHYVMPDCDRMTIIGLFPGANKNPNSSLSRYVTKAVEYFGDSNSQILVNEQGLLYPEIVAALKAAVVEKRPVMLLGASFSYVHLFDYLAQHHCQFRLPAGSRVFDTGGLKGQSRTVAQQDLLTAIADKLGISRDYYLNMYGMTEICSQCYDQNLQNIASKQPVKYRKQAPAWVRVQILDPDRLTPVPFGQTGLIAYYDLANWNSCVGILTEDLGIADETGFEILGRVSGAAAKGCSISIDQLVAAQTHKE
ncbi:MAG: LuxE/PaaK family acyltransferase [Lactobacillus sp.]